MTVFLNSETGRKKVCQYMPTLFQPVSTCFNCLWCKHSMPFIEHVWICKLID